MNKLQLTIFITGNYIICKKTQHNPILDITLYEVENPFDIVLKVDTGIYLIYYDNHLIKEIYIDKDIDINFLQNEHVKGSY